MEVLGVSASTETIWKSYSNKDEIQSSKGFGINKPSLKISEFMGIDNKNHLFPHLANTMKCRTKRSVYHRRKHKLVSKIYE